MQLRSSAVRLEYNNTDRPTLGGQQNYGSHGRHAPHAYSYAASLNIKPHQIRSRMTERKCLEILFGAITPTSNLSINFISEHPMRQNTSIPNTIRHQIIEFRAIIITLLNFHVTHDKMTRYWYRDVKSDGNSFIYDRYINFKSKCDLLIFIVKIKTS